MKVAFQTLGCKVNQYETEAIMEQFINAGHNIVAFNEQADVYIINTCTVTNMADKKSRQMIHRPKKRNAEAVVVAIGCFVQREDLRAEDFDGIDLVIGNTKKSQVFKLVIEYVNHVSDKHYYVESIKEQRDYDPMWLTDLKDKTRAHLKVQDGCNQFCSYCIIPYVRGRVRSRNFEAVIKEVNQLSSHGFKEVVLTGIHLASYEDEGRYLIDLIEAIEKVKGIERIRLGSLEPNLIKPEFVERLRKVDKICPQFHLSLQSGCDRTLKAMNRKYTSKNFSTAVSILRHAFNKISFTTDIIVGFPDETEVDFEETKAYVESIGFMHIHVFKYSARTGTLAAGMKNQINGAIKEHRSRQLIEIGNKSHHGYLDRIIGTTQSVLFEQTLKIDGEYYMEGHTTTYVRVLVKDPNKALLSNEIRDIKAKTIKDVDIIGEM